MIVTNTHWDSANAEWAKMPIYALQIAGQATVYTTHDLVRAGITGSLPAFQPWLKTPTGASQSIDVVQCSSSIGDLTCEVIDPNGSVLALVGSVTLEGATAKLLVGYPGLAWSEFVALQTYVIYKINPVGGYTGWNFSCRDKQLLLKKTIRTHPENGALLGPSNPWYLAGTAVEIFQAIALFAGHLNVTDVDVAGLTALDSPEEGLYCSSRPFLFALTEPFGAKAFLESEVLKPSGLYCVVTNTGQLSLRSFRPPAAGTTPVITFTEGNMVVLPEIDRMAVINEAIWQYDYDGSAYGIKDAYLEATSIGAFGRGNQWSIESKGLRSELGAGWYSQWVTSRMFRRFAGTPTGLKGGAPVLSIEAFLLTLPVWVGDFVAVTHARMPDVTTGTLGVTARIYEVIDRAPNYAIGRMTFKLLDTGLTGQPAAGTWGAGSAHPFVIGTTKLY